MRQVDHEAVRIALVKATQGHGNGKRFAKQFGVSQTIVAKTRTKRIPVGIKIAQALGYWVKHHFENGERGLGKLTYWADE